MNDSFYTYYIWRLQTAHKSLCVHSAIYTQCDICHGEQMVSAPVFDTYPPSGCKPVHLSL